MQLNLAVLIVAVNYCSALTFHNIFKRATDCGFKCKSGQCINFDEVCDGAKDCRDGSDETQATCSRIGVVCPSFAFRCSYGGCVDKVRKCDGVQDCADNSDELLPECKPNQKAQLVNKCGSYEYRCISGQCIGSTSVCDGRPDCDDGSDESITECINISCPHYSFQCAYGACIDSKKKCNNVDDCSDGSDEDQDLCKDINKPSAKPTRPPVYPQPQPGTRPTPAWTAPTPARPAPTRPVTRPPITESPIGSCLLPEKPQNGTYKVEGCSPRDNSDKCRSVPHTLVPPVTVLTFTCDPGYVIKPSANAFCKNGYWTEELPTCLKLCKPIVSTSHELECHFQGEPISCSSKTILPGTRLKAKCKSAYNVVEPSTVFLETKCGLDGFWDHSLFKCSPACGLANIPSAQALISNGVVTNQTTYPWHVGLYEKKGRLMEHICGGTIIGPRMVLTAAHCIYNTTGTRVKSARSFWVAANKFTRSWDTADGTEQKIRVKEIITTRRYQDITNFYEHDIAVLDLDSPIQIDRNVMPVCIDWLATITLSNGLQGVVVGWGRDENKEFSDVLKSTKMSYLSYDKCREKSPAQFLRYITADKFCAEYENGSGVQSGDSGGGFTYEKRGFYYLFGVVSTKPTQGSDTIAAFTDVSLHFKWLQSVMDAIDARKGRS